MGHLAESVKKHHLSKEDALVYFHASVARLVADLDHLGSAWQMGQIKDLLSDFASCFPTKKEAPNGQDEP